MQFEDLRAVLRLSASKALGSPAGGNFLAANAMLSVISGCSVLFLSAGPEAFKYPFQSGKRFREVLTYMPWHARTAGLQQGIGIKRMYSYARNPLAHAFGVSYHPGKASGQVPRQLQWSLTIVKKRLTVAEIHEFEVAVALPTFAGSPLKRTAKKTAIQPERLVLDVAGLYWGVHRMLHALLGDPAEVVKADDMARKLLEVGPRGIGPTLVGGSRRQGYDPTVCIYAIAIVIVEAGLGQAGSGPCSMSRNKPRDRAFPMLASTALFHVSKHETLVEIASRLTWRSGNASALSATAGGTGICAVTMPWRSRR